ncbi:transcriptional regulator, CarD family [Gottschalkia purinilytica]|uniref:Transcriptional regulator, CarD family n=1 Tax=Gottschalkia purinilytica TaxID=1503 RepID=A0A0L0W8X3_GOTPU|nr:CarD family transcriptional regulator [Gottschalkia purinilytica]KNF07988.1 transcriptional regulator, CarD family [Gottschalkia purinilytica]
MFNIGDKIVYPMHGAGVIIAVEEKEILGKKRKYYIMKMPIGDMKVMIPIDTIEDIGIRQVIDDKEIDQVFAVLSDDKTNMSQSWNRRYRANMDKIKSGDIYEIASVVRNLVIRDREKGLSTGERKMLNNAKQMLISEIVLAKNMERLDAENLVNDMIK